MPTVNAHLANLVAMLSSAIEEDWPDTNPAAGLAREIRRIEFVRF